MSTYCAEHLVNICIEYALQSNKLKSSHVIILFKNAQIPKTIFGSRGYHCVLPSELKPFRAFLISSERSFITGVTGSVMPRR